MSSHGEYGEFEEGINYVNISVSYFLSTAHAMALEGDFRALNPSIYPKIPYLGASSSSARRKRDK